MFVSVSGVMVLNMYRYVLMYKMCPMQHGIMCNHIKYQKLNECTNWANNIEERYTFIEWTYDKLWICLEIHANIHNVFYDLFA